MFGEGREGVTGGSTLKTHEKFFLFSAYSNSVFKAQRKCCLLQEPPWFPPFRTPSAAASSSVLGQQAAYGFTVILLYSSRSGIPGCLLFLDRKLPSEAGPLGRAGLGQCHVLLTSWSSLTGKRPRPTWPELAQPRSCAFRPRVTQVPRSRTVG